MSERDEATAAFRAVLDANPRAVPVAVFAIDPDTGAALVALNAEALGIEEWGAVLGTLVEHVANARAQLGDDRDDVKRRVAGAVIAELRAARPAEVLQAGKPIRA